MRNMIIVFCNAILAVVESRVFKLKHWIFKIEMKTEFRDWKTNESMQPKLQPKFDSCNTLPEQQTQGVVESFIPSA